MATRVGELSKFRNSEAHPKPFLVKDVLELLDGSGGEKGAMAGGKAKSSQGGGGGSGHSVAPVLMRYQRGCQQVGHELPIVRLFAFGCLED